MDNIIDSSFIVISDFDSNRWPLDEKIKFSLSEYDVVYILGNTSDIGNNGDRTFVKGKGNVQLLLEIMDLSKKLPNRIIYIPGNHDEILYDYAHNSSLGKKTDEYLMYDWVKGRDTLKELDLLKKEFPQRYEMLIDWLGKLPIQRKHSCNGQYYSLAHAFFNENIYKENTSLCLEDLFKANDNSYNSQSQILWFKNGDYYDVNDIPINSSIIVGNSPVQNINFKNSSGKMTEVFPINSGISYQRKNDIILKDSYDKSMDETRLIQKDEKQITSYSPADFEMVVDSIKLTYKKHGINHVRGTIIDWIFSDRDDWYMPISRPERFYVKDLSLDKVKAIIRSYSNINEKDPKIIADNFLNRVLSLKNDNEIGNPIKDDLIIPKGKNMIEESLSILDKIATKEEQSYYVSFKDKQYTLRDYVIDVLPRYYVNNELMLRINGKVISFQDYISNLLNGYKSRVDRGNTDDDFVRRIKKLKEQRNQLFNHQFLDYKPRSRSKK